MFGLEKIADAWDKFRDEQLRFARSEMQEWVTGVYQRNGENGWFYGAAVTAGVADALLTFTTGVTSGFVDTLRLGEGVKEGGWGYGKDALRLLAVLPAVGMVGKALRAVPLQLLPAAARTSSMACGFMAPLKASLLSGQRIWVTLGEMRAVFKPLSKGADIFAKGFAGMPKELTISGPAKILRSLGVAAETRGTAMQFGTVLETVRETKNPVVFSAIRGGKTPLNHVLTAFWHAATGEVRFADQGRWMMTARELATSLKGAEKVAEATKGVAAEGRAAAIEGLLKTLQVHPEMVVVQGARWATVLEREASGLSLALPSVATTTAGELYSDPLVESTLDIPYLSGIAVPMIAVPPPIMDQLVHRIRERQARSGRKGKTAPFTYDRQTECAPPNTGNAEMDDFLERRGDLVCHQTDTIKITRYATLSEVALYLYGDANKWPILYDLNKSVIGPRPNAGVKPGMVLYVRSRTAQVAGVKP
jgi:hypothetical protein